MAPGVKRKKESKSHKRERCFTIFLNSCYMQISISSLVLKVARAIELICTCNYIDKSVLVENRPLVKFIPNYIRDSSGVFSISSPVRISMTHKATGDDGVSAELLRIATFAITDSLCKLINYCIDTQTFPTKWKVGKVTPVYMGQGSRDDKNNYRPITVLPILSKLFKKHICDHLCDFLDENALLHLLQSGFRKFQSTETALIRLVDQLLLDLSRNKASGLVFIGYNKAFDLIDHGLLLTN